MFDKDKVIRFIKDALNEDIGRMDVTSTYLIPSTLNAKAEVTSHSAGVLAGLPFVETVYSLLDREIRMKFNVSEGGDVEPGKAVCFIEGPATSVLKGERLALNLLSRASGIATITKKFVDKINPYNVELFDTRKTTPNMRCLEKYAVRIGGGKNHRMGLYDQVLIKDNHLAILKAARAGVKEAIIIGDAVRLAKKRVQSNIKVEVEVKNIAECEEALAAGADIIMLDNMTPEKVKEAVKVRDTGGSKAKDIKLEASGNITLDNVEEYAKTGVDRISAGRITHSPETMDFSLEVF